MSMGFLDGTRRGVSCKHSGDGRYPHIFVRNTRRLQEVAISPNAEHNSAADKAVRATRNAANSKHAEALARLGLTARGAVYIVMGLLTLSVANGNRKEVDQRGALREVLHQPFGTLLVVLLAIGFACYSLWRFSEALFGVTGDPGSTFARVVSAFRGLAYALLTFTAVRRPPWIS